MAKNTVLDWDTTAANNTDIGGININEGCPAANINNAIREAMAQIKSGVDYKAVQSSKSANYTALAADNNAIIRFSAAATLSLTAAATLAANWHIKVVADGGAVIIDPNASETINGAATITIPDGFSAIVWCTGTAFFATKDWANTQTNYGELYRGHLNGLTLSNNGSDATNDIDIASGSAGSDGTTPVLMTLASALTKRLDAAWAVGTGNGGLDTGSIANTTYHVWLIQRSDTGVVDALFSASATSPTMPTNYDRKRRIGAIIRESATIVPFTQLGDEFLRKTAILSITAANPGTSAVTRTLNVPTGVQVWAKFNYHVINTGSGVSAAPLFTPLDVNDQAPDTVAGSGILASGFPANNSSGNAARSVGEMTVRTNTSAQIRSRLEGSDVNVGLRMSTLGWIDTRGRI